MTAPGTPGTPGTSAGVYQRRPTLTRAIRVSEALKLAACDWYALPDWLIQAYDRGGVIFISDAFGINARTISGEWVTALPHEWLLMGAANDIYPCDPSVFEATYEWVSP